ncbi:MAG TPA: cytochrome c, partial [Alicycliphilus sp.]|nr:cytochrome c [Alicycliphilus sp.]
FPPLDGSEWVQGEPRVLANILLHGITGEITVKGNKYQGAMPAFPQLSDAELAGIASFIRGNWSNKAEPLQAELFAKERADGSRTTPFEGEAALKALSP